MTSDITDSTFVSITPYSDSLVDILSNLVQCQVALIRLADTLANPMFQLSPEES